jgi:hypothetical protein
MALKFNKRVAAQPSIGQARLKSLQDQASIMLSRENLAAQAEANVSYQDELEALTINVVNGTAGDAPATCLLFDGPAISGVSNGADVTRTVSGGLTYANVVGVFNYSGCVCLGFQYQVTTPAQFGNTFKFRNTNLNGNQNTKTMAEMIALGKSPEYLNETLLKVETKPFVIDWSLAIEILLAANETINLTFVFAKQYRNS